MSGAERKALRGSASAGWQTLCEKVCGLAGRPGLKRPRDHCARQNQDEWRPMKAAIPFKGWVGIMVGHWHPRETESRE